MIGTVLIADRVEEFREALASALAPMCRVLCCARGDEALALLCSEKPELLILDLDLPGLDGLRLLEQLEERPPVLVVTELITDYVYGALLRLGVDYAIRKPCSVQNAADRAFDLLRSLPQSREMNYPHQLLVSLGLPAWRQGFQHLLTGLPLLARNRDQRLSKELYTEIAQLDHSSPAAVEKAIREVIREGWSQGDPREWHRYFPGATQCPRNKDFLFRMADLLRERQLCG